MAQSDWLTLNANRSYPFPTATDFTTNPVATFPGNAAFLDAGFNLGIDANFEPGRDKVSLYEWRVTATKVYFSFVVEYGATADYEPMTCFRFVFEFTLATDARATAYSTPTRDIGLLGEDTEENADLGHAFLTIGDISQITAALPVTSGAFTGDPQIEPATIQTQHLMFAKNIRVANESRVCPPACPCDDSSSSSLSSASSSSSSSSSSSVACTDPVPPEPTTAAVLAAVVLPSGTFDGDVKLKEGYNCQIDVSGNVIQISDEILHGEGMQCSDLRMTAAGDFEDDDCVVCTGWVKALNGQGYGVEHFQLIGGPSVIIEPSVSSNQIVVRFQEEAVCEVDI